LTNPIVSCGTLPPRPDTGAKLPRSSGAVDAACWSATGADELLADALAELLELVFFPLPPQPATASAPTAHTTTHKRGTRLRILSLLSRGRVGDPVLQCPGVDLPVAVITNCPAQVNRSFV
jgi:hypothetical protein